MITFVVKVCLYIELYPLIVFHVPSVSFLNDTTVSFGLSPINCCQPTSVIGVLGPLIAALNHTASGDTVNLKCLRTFYAFNTLKAGK